MKLSHSKLSCILSCPMSYYLTYEMGMYKKEVKPALSIGSAVHWGIEHNTMDLTDFWRENGGFKSREAYGRDQLLAEAMVYGYMKHKEEIFEQMLKSPKTGNKLQLLEETHEVYLSGKLNSTIVEYHDFVGIIDLLLLTDEGFILIDYKTSSQRPNWDNYLDQLYRYIFELRCNFPDIPVLKIGIINIRKTAIRQKSKETEFEFLQRMKFEYEINDEEYVNYHEFLPEELNISSMEDYINNLSVMADTAQIIRDNHLYFINYPGANGMYGKSDWWDIFYKTPNAEVLYGISDFVWNEDEGKFEDHRDCIALDMRVIDMSLNILNKYSVFEEHLLKTTTQTKEEFFNELGEEFVVDTNLLEMYWTTFVKKKEVKNDSEQQ